MLKKCRILICLILVVTFFVGITAQAAQQQPITVVLDGEVLEFDVPPQIIDGRTMVPMRVIFEALGAEIEWDGATQTVTATRGYVIVRATIGDFHINVNGVRTRMDIAPVLVNNRTLVPVRFISEAFGAEVDWYVGGWTVYIVSYIHPFEVTFESAEEP